jgi:hypothetical protein
VGVLWDSDGPIDFFERSADVTPELRDALLRFADEELALEKDDPRRAAVTAEGRALAARVAAELRRPVAYEGEIFRPGA